MKNFAYTRPATAREAVAAVAAQPTTAFLGGGTNLVDLMKYGVTAPDRLVDVTRLLPADITELPGGGVRIGAGASNTAAANHALLRTRYPAVSQALLSGATTQLRNMATMGGNLLQRTRCPYFMDVGFGACNKRQPGSGCAALEGFNRNLGILGTSKSCIATHPSDLCIALAAFDAVVQVQGLAGSRSIAFADFHRLPGDTPQFDNTLPHGELITALDLPALPWATHSYYLKIRDRNSYAFALVSVAAALDVQNGVIQQARLALGGVAHKPWRALEAERSLVGQPATAASFGRAAALAVAGAHAYEHNAFKPELARRTVVRALQTLVQA